MKKVIFFLLLVLSSQVGCTLTDPEVMEMLQALQAQNDKLLGEITSMKGQLSGLDAKYQAILAGLADNKKDLEALKGQVEALKTQITDQLKKIDQLTAQLTQQGADVVKLSAELAAVKASLADLLAQFEELIIDKNSLTIYEQNGTIKCPQAKVGDKSLVNGKQYEAVDRALLIKRRDEGADLTCVCTSLVTDMSNLFAGTEQNRNKFNQPIGNWDMSNVTNTVQMFFLSEFNQSIENWDVSEVTEMYRMFENSPFNQPLGNWNVSKVLRMGNMFRGTPFNQNILKWNVSKVIDMTQMFTNSQFNQPLNDWDVSNVVNMAFMFQGSKFNQPIGKWKTSKVTNMRQMFEGDDFSQEITNWDVSKVIDMEGMFLFNRNFNQPIGGWDVSNVTNMNRMFFGTQFNQPIENWNVSKVTEMFGMFFNSHFNQTIGKWNVRNVKNMNDMFAGSKFNQNISVWCVSQFTAEPTNFSAQSPLTAQNKPKWGTCPSPNDASGNLVDKYPVGSVFGASGPTIIIDVTNPRTGKTWMDRNLGASRAATSSTDAAAYGDLYQWGRGADGHQLRTSATTTTLSSTNQPGNGNFILPSGAPSDWRSPPNTNLWQGLNGTNNPCPGGYRLPTATELDEERTSWTSNNSAGAFASPLKLPMAGDRSGSGGSLIGVGTLGFYWSSTVNSTNSLFLFFNSSSSFLSANARAFGASVRCIKN